MEVIDTNYINDREIMVKKHDEINSCMPTRYYYIEIYANEHDYNKIGNIEMISYLEDLKDQILTNDEFVNYANLFFKGKDYSIHFGYDESFYKTEGRMMYLMSSEDL